MLSYLLTALAIIPLIGFMATLFVPKLQERVIFTIAMSTIALETTVVAMLICLWAIGGAEPLATSLGSLYSSEHYTFSFELLLDTLSAVFMGVATLITLLIFIFSKYYMHREPGFKRFYFTVLLFFIGLTFITLAGNFEVLLVGWEFIGISSVLLIAFYRDRFLPARNALKVFSIYRIADAFLLAAIWYAHHIFEHSAHFSEFATIAGQHSSELAILGLLLLVVAAIKSAQFPFSYWLPRAMEGPTSSSAIFYGALSVHMGLFILLRSYPLWEGIVWLHVAVGVVGLVTAFVASSIARVQSSIKSQIAYSSITQIGIMFVELALGLWWLALIHFVCNAFLRTYQLLISPSIVGYMIHDQFFHFTTPKQRIDTTPMGKIRATLYVLGIQEWNMNTAFNRYLWKPLKTIGRALAALDKTPQQLLAVAVFMVGATLVVTHADVSFVHIPLIAGVLSILFFVRAYTIKGSVRIAWNLMMLGQLFVILFLTALTEAHAQYVAIYSSGILVAYLAGHLCLSYLATKKEELRLRYYQGLSYMHKTLAHVFFVVCLVFMTFPLTPAFLAQETLLSHITTKDAWYIGLFCVAYLLLGIGVMRLYTKLFFGPHSQNLHEKSYKSS